MSERRDGRQAVPHDVLVGVVRTPRDLGIVRDQGWYRIPVSTAPRRSWPPKRLAFYEVAGIGGPQGAVRRFADVRRIETATREELFPGEPAGAKTGTLYHRIELGPVQELGSPILLTRPRPLSFISTTLERLLAAETVNDLYGDSYLEDVLWKELKSRGMPAERQWRERTLGGSYVLDFAMFCDSGKIDVETDGDAYHANSRASVRDNVRNNRLEVLGWRVLRFNTPALTDQTGQCISTIVGMVRRLGGFDSDGLVPRRWSSGGDAVQLSLMEERADWDQNAGSANELES